MEATVVSTMPYPFRDSKPGLFPAEYNIPATDGERFRSLIVMDAKRGVYMDSERGTEHVFESGHVVAISLVQDYILSQPLQDQEAYPGLFYVKEIQSKEDILRKPKILQLLEATEAAQRKWFLRLVKNADDLWVRHHQHNHISDLERVACRFLGLKRDWLSDDPMSTLKCPVCTTLVSSDAIICYACKVILKSDEYKKFQFAGPVQALNTK